MEEDAKLSIIAATKTPRFLHSGLVAGSVGQNDMAHGDAYVPLDVGGGVVKTSRRPWLERETLVVRERGVPADKVGERTLAGDTERLVAVGQGRFEKNGGQGLVVSGVDDLLGKSLGVAPFPVGLADGYEGVAPTALGGLEIGDGDGWRPAMDCVGVDADGGWAR